MSANSVQQTATEYEFPPTVVRAVQKPYDARIQEVTSAGSLEERISDRDRIVLGLIALANRERQLVLEHHGLQTVSGDIIEALLRNAGEIYDGARTGGRIGYNRAARKILRLPRAFRVAYSLHRWTGIEKPLARQVAKRFDKFLVRRLVLEELIRFNSRNLKPLLGARVAELLGEVLTGRLDASTKALDALGLQYPEYAEALSQRFLRKLALRRELAHFESLFEDGLIGQELFEDLRRGVDARQREAERRPKLDLKLDKVALIAQVPLFNTLAPDESEAAGACAAVAAGAAGPDLHPRRRPGHRDVFHLVRRRRGGAAGSPHPLGARRFLRRDGPDRRRTPAGRCGGADLLHAAGTALPRFREVPEGQP